jgi:hypothetical protein
MNRIKIELFEAAERTTCLRLVGFGELELTSTPRIYATRCPLTGLA